MNVKMKTVTKQTVFLAIMLAMEIVLSRFLSISLWNIKYGFAFVAVMLAGYFTGFVGGALVGGLGDLIGALLFPIGAYFPGFTLTAALTGAVFGLLINKKYEKQSVLKILLAVLSTQIVCGLLLNTLWISILYGSPFKALLVTRLPQILIMSAIEIAFAFLVFVLDRVPALKKMI